MKKLILLIVLIPSLMQAQVIIGKWNRILSVQGMELRLVFHISRGDSTYDAKMDSPDQKAFGIPASTTNNKLIIPEGMNKEEFIKAQVSQFKQPWMRYFLKYDPVNSLERIKCPVLALNGEKDVQVSPENLIFIEKAIRHGGNDNVTIKEFPDMNHLFQTCKTGAMDEYATIEQTMDPLVLGEISGWVLKQTK